MRIGRTSMIGRQYIEKLPDMREKYGKRSNRNIISLTAREDIYNKISF